MSKAKIDKKTQEKLDKLHEARIRLEQKAIREMSQPLRNAKAGVRDQVERLGSLEKEWNITLHALALPSLRQEARSLGSELTNKTKAASEAAAKLAIIHWVVAWRLFGKQATGRSKIPVPNINPNEVAADAVAHSRARTMDIGANAGESIGQTIAAVSLTQAYESATVSGAGAAVASSLEARAKGEIERVIITEVSAGYSGGMQAMMIHVERRVPEIRKIWDATLDRKVCRLCAPMHHLHVPVNEPWPNGLMAPPAHPRCRCAAMPWMEEWTTVLEELEIKPGPRTGFSEDMANEWWDRPF